ncbi:MAG: FlgO family outer membrane protein [Bryobacteraceae bacterium]
MMAEQIGNYKIVRKIGEGGMGVVFAARDERLDRIVALKLLRESMTDEPSRHRFWREARAAAGVSHPNVCQIFEAGEEQGQLYLAMELLEGESLADGLKKGPLAEGDAIRIMLGVLSALEAIHAKGLIHRDLKPSNVFLTPHGPKVLDFGLARHTAGNGGSLANLTKPGHVLGTPRYMSPEQLQGRLVTTSTDLFAAGVLLYEMVSGKPAFGGDTMMAVFHSILYDPTPTLSDRPGLDSVVHRAMARSPEERYSSASAMAEALRTTSAQTIGSAQTLAPPPQQTRLIVLPFRMLRPDPETDFLTFSLPDAITTSLSGLHSLTVRSSLVGTRFSSEKPDLREISEKAQVDVVLTGTLLRAGEQIRVAVQLVEAPEGKVVWSQTSQERLEDIFRLQDTVVNRVVESLALPLSTRERQALCCDVPADAAAYEFYLRGNELAREPRQLTLARDMYRQCVERDPRFAPAWARLGRCEWLTAKWLPEAGGDISAAEKAFDRAFALNPDLAIAHHYYGRFEADRGRGRQAMHRLIPRALASANDAELYAGLSHVCRYLGLLDASVAAGEKASQLDPQVATSVEHTYFLRGDLDKVLSRGDVNFGYMRLHALAVLGREAEALQHLESLEGSAPMEMMKLYAASLRATLRKDQESLLDAVNRLAGFALQDSEGRFYTARMCSHLGLTDKALELLDRSLQSGYCPLTPMRRDPWLEPVREKPKFADLLATAEASYAESLAAYRAAGGEKLLGIAG